MNSTAWDRSSGPLVYTAFERKGRFIPATEAQAAQNVPYPIQQPGMDNYDRAGLYASWRLLRVMKLLLPHGRYGASF